MVGWSPGRTVPDGDVERRLTEAFEQIARLSDLLDRGVAHGWEHAEGGPNRTPTGRSATLMVAGDGSSGTERAQADRVASGPDCYPVLQRALDAVGDWGGGVVQVASGRFPLANQLTVPSRVWLRGCGPSSLLEALGSWQIVVQGKLNGVKIGISDLKVKSGRTGVAAWGGVVYGDGITDFSVVAVETEGGLGSGIKAYRCNRALATRCFAADALDSGIDFQYSDRSSIIDNNISGSGTDGIDVFSGATSIASSSQYMVVMGNRILSAGSNGIVVGITDVADGDAAMEHFSILGNVIELAGTHGIIVGGGARYGVIANNAIRDATNYGVYVDRGTHSIAPAGIKILGNDVYSCGGGILLDSSQSVLYRFIIAENELRENNAHGIILNGGANAIGRVNIIGNLCSNNGLTAIGDGILLASQATGGVVEDINVIGNQMWDSQGTPTQRYSLNMIQGGGGTIRNCLVDGNTLGAAATAVYQVQGTGHVFGDNRGYP